MTTLEEVVEITIVRQLDDKESKIGGKWTYKLAVKGWNYRFDKNDMTDKEVLKVVKDYLKYIPHLREQLLGR